MTEEKLNHKTLKKDEFEKINIFGMGNLMIPMPNIL